jgi:phosphopantothenoylcysteine decarboxylase/phosphopantothenate--cysteine ligase
VSKSVVLGVTGSIAVYRAAELCSALRKEEIGCRVIMSRWATRFVTPLTFSTLTQNAVITDDNIGDYADRPEHLALGDVADLFLVAPATANIIAKMAHGIADDIVSTTYISVTCPVLVAPAMNTRMWDHVTVQENIATLTKRGVKVLQPDDGFLACGDYGKGRLAEPEIILEAARAILAQY